jgi:hypothetical protein
MKIKYKISKKALKYLPNDQEYREEVIEKVEDLKDNWDIGTNIGNLLVPKCNTKFVPEAGMITNFYGKGLGHTIRGVTIPAHNIIFYYRTPEEEEQRFKEEQKECDKEREKAYKKNKAKYEKSYKALPKVFQDRIDKFRKNNPTFNRDFLSYQLFCDEEAIKIASKLKTVEQINNFIQMSWDAQRKIVDVDPGHSGNSFGYTICNAKLWLTNPEQIINYHGALSKLVGCEAYGCHKKGE